MEEIFLKKFWKKWKTSMETTWLNLELCYNLHFNNNAKTECWAFPKIRGEKSTNLEMCVQKLRKKRMSKSAESSYFIIEDVGGGHQENVTTTWLLSWTQSEALHTLPYPWNIHSAYQSHSESCSKDISLREQCVVLTIWMICVTESN